jgi:hypothetical protein
LVSWRRMTLSTSSCRRQAGDRTGQSARVDAPASHYFSLEGVGDRGVVSAQGEVLIGSGE